MRKLWIAASAMALLSGCDVLSVRPLATDQELVSEPGVVGMWKDPDGDDRWVVREAKRNVYEIIGKKDERYEARLTRIGGVLFADIAPAESLEPMIPGHQFAKVRIDGDRMHIAFVDWKWIRRQISPRAFPQHMDLNADRTLLLANGAELRKYLESYVHTAAAFHDEGVLRRE